jgi:hypothetical protein
VLVSAATLAPSASAEADPAPSAWRPPVDAPVVDPFRPPSPWGLGNRGLAYGTADGDPVRAVAEGTVSFTDRVGVGLHVTVDHGNGLRSTYAFLASALVVRGQRVAAGQLIGTATTGFHLTARVGDRYVDPSRLLAGEGSVPRLLPEHGTDGPGSAGRTSRSGWFGPVLGAVSSAARRAPRGVADAAGAAGGGLARATAGAGAALADVRDVAWVLLGTASLAIGPVLTGPATWADVVAAWQLDPALAFAHLIHDLLPSVQALALSGAVIDWQRSGRNCTADDVVVPPGGKGRVLIQVGGLGTASGAASIAKLDPVLAGYDPRDVVGFSYAGGCTPAPFGSSAPVPGSLSASLPARPYDAGDTHQDVDVSASRLADLVDAVHAARPDAAIDLAAHSLGGVVARRALEILTTRHGGQPPVSVVLTVGSPHDGTELAGAASAVHLDPQLSTLLHEHLPDRAAEGDAVSVSQLAPGTRTQLPPPTEPPPGVRVVSIGGAGDVVVPGERTRWQGATNTVIGSPIDVGTDVHGELPGRPEVQRELALAVAGLPARCLSFAAAIGSAVTSRVVAATEGAIAVAAIVLPFP